MTPSTTDPRVLDLPRLYVVALTVVPVEEDAWDSVQEAILAVLQRPQVYRSIPCLCALVRSLAREGVLPEVNMVALHDVTSPPASDADPAELAASKEGRQLVLDAIQRLPDHLQHVVTERHLQGRRMSEIAAQVGVSERAVRYQLREAMEHLRRHVESDFA